MNRILIADCRTLRPAAFTPPVSKSDAQRAAVLARIQGMSAPWEHVLRSADAPDDLRALMRGLDALERARTQGTPETIDCGDGGTPFRFLLAQAALFPSRIRFTGSRRLGERPRAALLDALRAALGDRGLDLFEGTPWPLQVTGAHSTGEPVFRVSAAASSQFASALLLAAAGLSFREKRDWRLVLEGEVASRGYLDLTVSWLEKMGFRVVSDANELRVRSVAPPASAPSLPGDWSSAGYLLLLAWKTGGSVRGLDLTTPHPDRAVVDLLTSVGLSVQQADGATHVGGAAHSGLSASAAHCPDLIPTLAALACVLPKPSAFSDLEILRHKESDRLQGIQELVEAGGARAEPQPSGLRVIPSHARPAEIRMDSHADHRLAMSAAVLACLTGATLSLAGPDCVAKSFPGFWGQLERAGAVLR